MEYKSHLSIITLCSSLFVLPLTTQAAERFNAKTYALGGVGVASADFSDGVLLNPALAGKSQKSDDFNINFNIGAQIGDEDTLSDELDALDKTLDELETQDTITLQQAIDLNDQLADLNDKKISLAAGGEALIGIPNKYLGASFFVTGSAQGQFEFVYNGLDADVLLDLAITGGAFTANIIDSDLRIDGVVDQNIGIALAYELDNDLIIGVSPRIQTIGLFTYRESVHDIDDEELNTDENLSEETNFNADIGLHKTWKNWQMGLTARNVLSNEYVASDGSIYEVTPQLVLGTAYQNSWFKLGVDYALDANPTLKGADGETLLGGEQMLRAGVEIDAFNFIQLRAGYKTDMEDIAPDMVTLGAGISPFDVINIDVALAFSAESDDANNNEEYESGTFGFAAQFGFQF